jgi:hypothetical protein
MAKIDRSNGFQWVLCWLRQEPHCDPAVYADLIRTPAMNASAFAACAKAARLMREDGGDA